MKHKFMILLLVIVLRNPLYAWENKITHPTLTDEAVRISLIDSYLKTQMGLTEGTTTQLYWDFPQDIETRIGRGDANPNQKTRNVSEWLRIGSIIEDQDTRFFPPPWRPRHHFHAPIHNAGLDNKTKLNLGE